METSADIKGWLQQQAKLLGVEAPNMTAEDIRTFFQGPIRRLLEHAVSHCKRSEKLEEMQRAVTEYNQMQARLEEEAEATMKLKEEKRQRLAEVTNQLNSLVDQSLAQHRHTPKPGEAAVQLTSDDLMSDVYCCRQRSSAMRQGTLALDHLRTKLKRRLLPTLTALLEDLRDASALLHLDNSSADDTCTERDEASNRSQPTLADPQQLEVLQGLLQLLSLDPVCHSGQAPGVETQGADRPTATGARAGTEEGELCLKRPCMGLDDLTKQVQAVTSAFHDGLRQSVGATAQGGDSFHGSQGAACSRLMGSHGLGERFRTFRGMRQSLVSCLAALTAEDAEAMTATPSVCEGISQLNSAASAADGTSASSQSTRAQTSTEGSGATQTSTGACKVWSASLGSSAQCSTADADPLQDRGVQFVARCRDREVIEQHSRMVQSELADILDPQEPAPAEGGAGVEEKENQGAKAGQVGKDEQGAGHGHQAHEVRLRKAKEAAAVRAWEEEMAIMRQELEGRKGAFADMVQLRESLEELSAVREQAWCELDAVTEVNALFEWRLSSMVKALKAFEGESKAEPAYLDCQELDTALGMASSCQGQLREEVACTLAMTEGLAAPQPLGLHDTEASFYSLADGLRTVPQSGSTGGAGGGAEGGAEAERQRRAVAPATGYGPSIGADLSDDLIVSPLGWWQGVDVLASWPALPSTSAPAIDASALPPWSQFPPKTSIPVSMQATALEAAQHLRDIRSLSLGLVPRAFSPFHSLSEDDAVVKTSCKVWSGSLLQVTTGASSLAELDRKFQEDVDESQRALEGRQSAVARAAACLTAKTQDAQALRKDFSGNVEKLMEVYEKHPAAFKLPWVLKDGKTAEETLDMRLGRSNRAPASASLFTTPVGRGLRSHVRDV